MLPTAQNGTVLFSSPLVTSPSILVSVCLRTDFKTVCRRTDCVHCSRGPCLHTELHETITSLRQSYHLLLQRCYYLSLLGPRASPWKAYVLQSLQARSTAALAFLRRSIAALSSRCLQHLTISAPVDQMGLRRLAKSGSEYGR